MGALQSQSSFTVLVVDDVEENRMVLEAALDLPQFQTVTAASGEECLKKAGFVEPDIILLDVRMPGMNGYETCKQLRERQEFRLTPIIFLSVLDTLDDILAGYEAGGDDFVSKPFDHQVLIAKINNCLNQRREIKQNLEETHQFAHLTLVNSGELGVVLKCYQDSFQCHSHEQLANTLLSACKEFDLNCCAQIRGALQNVNISSSGFACSSIEVELMNHMVDADRILHFGNRTSFNFDNVTLLAKNMPIHDEDKNGRLTDHIASLLMGIEARAETLDIEIAKEEAVFESVKNSLTHIHWAIEKIEGAFVSRDHLTSDIISTLLSRMTDGFTTLALSEEQEEFFINLLNTHLDQIVELYGAHNEIKDYFMQIAGRLTPLLERSGERTQDSGNSAP